MYKTIEEYLEALKRQMEGIDSATIQDALADAEEHLRTALEIAGDNENALAPVIEEYGTPEETAAAYAEVERRTAPALTGSVPKKKRSGIERFFAIYADPKAWGALLYLLITLITGIVYFSWVTIGLSLSISLSIFIFGLFIALLFVTSIRGIALLEGRIVEALLGIRMPRRPLFSPRKMTWRERLISALKEKQTWRTALYMLLQLPMGLLYFTGIVFMLAFSLAFITTPLRELGFHIPLAYVNGVEYFTPPSLIPLEMLGGFLLWTTAMHLIRWVGGLHGKYAKAMLVVEQD